MINIIWKRNNGLNILFINNSHENDIKIKQAFISNGIWEKKK